jgi:Ras-related GTP-binding protein C/D
MPLIPWLERPPLPQVTEEGGSSSQTPRVHQPGYESPAQLNLQRVYEQNRRGIPKRDVAKPPTELAAPGVPIKGKPRLLLMGQRRLESLPNLVVQFCLLT